MLIQVNRRFPCCTIAVVWSLAGCATAYAPPRSGDALGESLCRSGAGAPAGPCSEQDSGDWTWARCAARVAFRDCDYRGAASLYQLSISRCEQAGQAVPAGLYAGMGHAQSVLGQLEQALDSYYRATELAPAEAGLWAGLGTALERLGRRDEACLAYARP